MQNKCVLSSVNSPYKYGITPVGYVSSFAKATGCDFSSGICIEFKTKKAVFVDGRYTTEATRKLTPIGFDVLHLSYKDISEWIANHIPENEPIYFFAHEFSVSDIEQLEKAIPRKLYEIEYRTRNTPHKSEIFFVNGSSFKCNFQKIEYIFEKHRIDNYLICDSLSIAWLLNLRSCDDLHTPVLLCRAIINKNGKITIYAENKINNQELLYDRFSNIKIKNITELELDLNKIENIATDFSEIPYYIRQKAKFKHIKNPCLIEKCIKTDEQIEDLRQTNIFDSVAIVKFMYWLSKQKEISERSASKKIDFFRSRLPGYICKSFENIVAIDENSAEIHHNTDKNADEIKPFNVLLFDTGGQYKAGTTDITRTICRNPSKKFKYFYTLVLKGHIDLFLCDFDKNTKSSELDRIARLPLLNAGVDYQHGTGHGIGYVSHVHETCVYLASRDMEIPLQKNMVISNEPGYYANGEFGIRIENSMVICRNDEKLNFKTLTLVPYDTNSIELEMLTENEKNWLITYNEKVISELSKFLSRGEISFLREITSFR